MSSVPLFGDVHQGVGATLRVSTSTDDVEKAASAPTYSWKTRNRGKERGVKYIALIHNNPAAWKALSQAERDTHNSDADVYLEMLTDSGELVGGAVVLAHPMNAKTVRVRSGVPAVTDGPFAEGKEHLAGYYVLDCESIERATEIVTNDPSARHFAVEVRPIMHMTSSDL
jgi:hypothetical protein